MTTSDVKQPIIKMKLRIVTNLLFVAFTVANANYYVPNIPRPRCPPLPPDTVGICVDLCTDYSCPGDQLCCSNGCGRVCKDAYYDGCPGGLQLACKPPACDVTTCPRQIEATCRPTCFGCIPHFFDQFNNEVTEKCGCLNGEQPVQCFDNPCRQKKCRRHPKAVCRTNTCGTCEAIFYDRFGNEVNCEPVCKQEKDPGPCEALIPRYYYNTESRRCERFIYGGCQGNENNFKTLKKCQRTCGHDICKQPKDSGPCEAAISRYFFNTKSQACEQFIYGGCQGNDNNFKTLQKCQIKCGGYKFDPKCPSVPRDQAGICIFSCSSNSDCKREGQICCSNGCGSTCVYPPLDKRCPPPDPEIIRTLPFRICPQPSCFSNDVCRKGDICCSNGCQQNCISPPFTDPRCLIAREKPGRRRERCQSNLDCRNGKICCSNGRGTECQEVPDQVYRCPAPIAPVSQISCPKICDTNSDCRSDHMCCDLICGTHCTAKPRPCDPNESMHKCINLCEGLVCRKYPGAKCRVHGCSGCKAEFYDDQDRRVKDCDDIIPPPYL
uniref:papilin-like n=1 Tax=Styela clava TaxID=7725 RepID=UPI00193940A5|nr:papilin-like [Styela clava]